MPESPARRLSTIGAQVSHLGHEFRVQAKSAAHVLLAAVALKEPAQQTQGSALSILILSPTGMPKRPARQ